MPAVIFDMDGTLINSEDLWRRAEISCFAKAGVTLTEDDCKETIGVRIDQVVEYWRERKIWVGISNQDLTREIVDEVAQLFAAEPNLRDGALELIEEFEKMGIPQAVASASPQRLIDKNLEAVGIRNRFRLTHSAEFEQRGKPDPAVFLTAAKRLGVEPAECVVFEDSLNGIRAARAAGMTCIAIQEPATPFDQAQSLANYAIESFRGFRETELFHTLFSA